MRASITHEGSEMLVSEERVVERDARCMQSSKCVPRSTGYVCKDPECSWGS